MNSPRRLMVNTGAELIAAERIRQISGEGWLYEHDDDHVSDELVEAAICYSYKKSVPGSDSPNLWPWNEEWWKPKDRVNNLIRAGALIAAEIDRLHRREESDG